MRVLQYLSLVSAIVCILAAPNGTAKEIGVTSKPYIRPSVSSSESSDSSGSSNESSSDDRSMDSSGSIEMEKAAESTSGKQPLKSVSSLSLFALKTNSKNTTTVRSESLDSNSKKVTSRNKSSGTGQSNSGKRDRFVTPSSLNTSDRSNESSESSSDELKPNGEQESSASSRGEHKLSESSSGEHMSSESSSDEHKSSESSNDEHNPSESSSSEHKSSPSTSSGEHESCQREVNASIHEGQESSTSNSSKYNTISSRTDNSKESMENHKLEKSSRSLESENSTDSSIESSSESYAKESYSNDPEPQSRSDSKLKRGQSSNFKSTNASKSSEESDETNMEIEQTRKCPKQSASKAETKRSEQNVPSEFWEFWEFWESWKERNENNRNIKRNDLSKAATDSARNTVSRESESTSRELHKEKELDRRGEESWSQKSLNRGRPLSEQSSDISMKARDFNAILKITTEINSWKSFTELSLMRLINKISGYALTLQNINTNNSDWFRKGCKDRQLIIERAIANLNRHVAGITKNFRHAVIKCNADLKKTATQLHANIRNLIESVTFSGNNQSSDFDYITNSMHELVALTIQNSKIKLLHFYHDNEHFGVITSGSTYFNGSNPFDDRLQRAQEK